MMSRYILHDIIGQGGMGIVYRATDRLKNTPVALKQVSIANYDDIDLSSYLSSYANTTGKQLALAQEFQTLASLRHPHIVSVLDYGFDQQNIPYFTMDYLENAQPLSAFAGTLDALAKVRLLQQVLEALAYLHHRGVLHRDLKPNNILVYNKKAYLLDFGLSMAKDKATELVGSWKYVAPEILNEEKATEASDLYALGVIAYELFAHRHPFDTRQKSTLIKQTLQKTPDYSLLQCDGALQQIIQKLLQKSPQDRYQEARPVILAFSQAMGISSPTETLAIRNSYLQATKFIGREAELEQLLTAMQEAQYGNGSAWLIGGESGIGKSRLVAELRTRALVDGALVLNGYGIEGGGGVPYQLWQDAIRRLALEVHLDDLTASVLQTIVPDLDDLLERLIFAAPPIEEKAAQQRLFNKILYLFRQQNKWMLLILEDLHWGQESLELLRYLNLIGQRLPLLIAGTYRHDERPNLPAELPRMNHILLNRFSANEMARLSTAMIGKAGRNPAIRELLQRETEGNPFFLVETVRTLADMSGKLEHIGDMNLPATLFPQGIQSLVQRRLVPITGENRTLLEGAAIAGRKMDDTLLQYVAAHYPPDISLASWFNLCAQANVLEIQDGVWQFTHDKLREGVLATLSSQAKQAWHQLIAEAIETVYPHDISQASNLLHHYHHAGIPQKERDYARLAGEHAGTLYNNKQAVTLFTRALALTPATELETRYELLLARAKIYDLQGQPEAQAADLESLYKLAQKMDTAKQSEVALQQSKHAYLIGQYPPAIAYAQTVVTLAQESEDAYQMVRGYVAWSRALQRQGDPQAVQEKLAQAQQLTQTTHLPVMAEIEILEQLTTTARNLGDYEAVHQHGNQLLAHSQEQKHWHGEIIAYRELGFVALRQGQHEQATHYFQAGFSLCRQVGSLVGEALFLQYQGFAATDIGDYQQVQQFYEQSLDLFRQANDRHGETVLLISLGDLMWRLGEYAQAEDYLQQALAIRVEVGGRQDMILINLGNVALDREQYAEAQAHYEKSLELCRQKAYKRGEGYVLNGLALLAYRQAQYEQATQYYKQALAIRQAMNTPALAIEDLAGLMQIALAQDDLQQAQTYLTDILLYLEGNPAMDGAERPFLVHLACYHVLAASQDTRATSILQQAYEQLQQQANRISGEMARHAFLHNVHPHRELLSLYQTIE